jgi:hypothetical protein
LKASATRTSSAVSSSSFTSSSQKEEVMMQSVMVLKLLRWQVCWEKIENRSRNRLRDCRRIGS